MRWTRFALALLLAVGIATTAQAHVPYLEGADFTPSSPFRPRSAVQSIAVYAWLESAKDVDPYVFTVREETPLFAEVLVPAFEPYATFRPSFALVGPGLPEADGTLPFTVRPGNGVLVFHDEGATPRPCFHEPFGGKSYYRGPRVERTIAPGTYALVFWHPEGQRGDYVAVIGKKELWPPRDIARALRITPIIRRHGELHLKELEQEEAGGD